MWDDEGHSDSASSTSCYPMSIITPRILHIHSSTKGEKTVSLATPLWPASPHPKNQTRWPYKASTEVLNLVKLQRPVVHRYIYICNAMFRSQNVILSKATLAAPGSNLGL